LVNEDKDVETLTWLGLTERQAKVYLTLLHIGVSKAEAISKASTIHRQEIYRVAARLQEMGLVETKVTSPTMFGAVPAKDALEIMVNQKTKELDEVRDKTRSLIERFNQTDLKASPADKPYFTIVSGVGCLRKLQNALEESLHNVKIACTLRRFCKGFTIHEDSVKLALKKKVDLQVITESPNGVTFPKLVSQLLLEKTPNFKVRIARKNLPTCMALYDDRRLCVTITNLPDLAESQLWSNSESLIVLSREYFKNMWANSKSYSLKE
jgi:sugar-specific transcriptional regulator TrmB